jgi:hypothetical protein
MGSRNYPKKQDGDGLAALPPLTESKIFGVRRTASGEAFPIFPEETVGRETQIHGRKTKGPTPNKQILLLYCQKETISAEEIDAQPSWQMATRNTRRRLTIAGTRTRTAGGKWHLSFHAQDRRTRSAENGKNSSKFFSSPDVGILAKQPAIA